MTMTTWTAIVNVEGFSPILKVCSHVHNINDVNIENIGLPRAKLACPRSQ